MVPLSAGALYPWMRVPRPPWVAGACMAFSRVSGVSREVAVGMACPVGLVVCSPRLLGRYRRPAAVMRGVAVLQR